MRYEDIRYFLSLLGCREPQLRADDWVSASCPYESWLHSNGRDRTPSLFVKINDEGLSGYNCFGCGCKGGDLSRILSTLTFKGIDVCKATEFWQKAEIHTEVDSFANWEPKEKIYKKSQTNMYDKVVPEEILRSVPLIMENLHLKYCKTAFDWLCDIRKITPEVISKYKLRAWFDFLSGETAVVFPVIKTGFVFDMYMRYISGKSFLRLNADATGSDVDYRSPWLYFGESEIQDGKPFIIMEGALDVLRWASLSKIPAIATMGPPKKKQAQRIPSRVIYIGFDNDLAGEQFAGVVKQREPGAILYRMDWGIAGVKDAGDLENSDQIENIFESMKII